MDPGVLDGIDRILQSNGLQSNSVGKIKKIISFPDFYVPTGKEIRKLRCDSKKNQYDFVSSFQAHASSLKTRSAGSNVKCPTSTQVSGASIKKIKSSFGFTSWSIYILIRIVL